MTAMPGEPVDRRDGDVETDQGTGERRPGGRLTLADFAPLVGERFRLDAPSASGESLELVKAEAFEARRATPSGDGFSLVFRAAKTLEIPQATLRLHHDAIGATDLFVVTIGIDDEGRLMEAVFN